MLHLAQEEARRSSSGGVGKTRRRRDRKGDGSRLGREVVSVAVALLIFHPHFWPQTTCQGQDYNHSPPPHSSSTTGSRRSSRVHVWIELGIPSLGVVCVLRVVKYALASGIGCLWMRWWWWRYCYVGTTAANESFPSLLFPYNLQRSLMIYTCNWKLLPTCKDNIPTKHHGRNKSPILCLPTRK